MSKSHKDQLVDAVRVMMYGDGDVLQEAMQVATILGVIDGVEAHYGKNRIVVALELLKDSYQIANEAPLDEHPTG
jgi:hypothetical protein